MKSALAAAVARAKAQEALDAKTNKLSTELDYVWRKGQLLAGDLARAQAGDFGSGAGECLRGEGDDCGYGADDSGLGGPSGSGLSGRNGRVALPTSWSGGV